MATVDETLTTLANASESLIAVLATSFQPPRTVQQQFLPDTIKSAARPAIAYLLVDDVPAATLKGKPKLYRARYQLSIFARTSAERASAVAAIRATFETYRDRDSGGIIDWISVDTVLNQHDGVTNDYISFVDLIIWHLT